MRTLLLSIAFLCLCPWVMGGGAFAFQEANRLYKSLPSSSEAVREVGDYLFFRIEWTHEPDEEEEDAEELDAIFKALTCYLTPAIPPRSTPAPFGKALMSWLEPTFTPPTIPTVSSCTLERKETGNKRFLVVAYDAAPLRDARQKAQAAAQRFVAERDAINDDGWAARLREALENAATAKDRYRYLALLGCPVVHWAFDAQDLKQERFYRGTEIAWKERETLLSAWTASKVIARPDFLTESPAMIQASAEELLSQAKVLQKKNFHAEAIAAYLMALRHSKLNADAWQGLYRALVAAGCPCHAKGVQWLMRAYGVPLAEGAMNLEPKASQIDLTLPIERNTQ